MYWNAPVPLSRRSTTAVALRTVSICSGVASPITLAASAGSGKGMRWNSSAGRPGPANLAHTVLAELDQRLDDAVSERLLRDRSRGARRRCAGA